MRHVFDFNRLVTSIQMPIYIIGLSWFLEMGQFLLPFLNFFDEFGIIPRTRIGLFGIVLGPLLHGGFGHLVSNTIPFIALFGAIIYFYPRVAWQVLIFIWFLTGGAVWLAARDANHIGASGLVFGFSTFLFSSGFFRRDFISLVISLTVYFFYGSMWVGVMPGNPYMSWESHLAGAVAGLVAGYYYAPKRKPPAPKESDFSPPGDGLD